MENVEDAKGMKRLGKGRTNQEASVGCETLRGGGRAANHWGSLEHSQMERNSLDERGLIKGKRRRKTLCKGARKDS